MLRRFSIATRLFGLVGLVILFAAVALAFVAAITSRLESMVVHHTQEVMLDGEKSKIQAATHAVALTLGEGLKFSQSDEDRKALVRKVLDPVRFEADKSGYFFVYQGTMNVALPPQAGLQGQDLKDFMDRDGVYYVRELSKQAHAGGGYVSYMFPKPSGAVEPKLSYAEMIPDTDFWIGTGVYLDNVDQEKAMIAGSIGQLFDKAMTATAVVSVVMVAVLSLLCLAIARSVSRPLAEATGAAERIASGDLDVRLAEAGRDEAARLQAALNRMTGTLRLNIREIQARRAEAEEKAHQAEQALEEARRANQEVVSQVALRIESLQKISSAVAHQLRNPTTIIGGLAGLLLKKPSLKESYLEYLDGIISAAQRIEHITAAVREYSSIHIGHLSETPAEDILAAGREAGEARAREMGKPVVWQMDPGNVSVFADKELVSMAVREVAENAVEALPPIGGHVRLDARTTNGVSELSVTDNGRGISAEEQEYVLDPFYTTKSVGVGMGLTKTNRVAQEHGGSLQIESQVDQGTTVRLLFPTRLPVSSRLRPPPASSRTLGDRQRPRARSRGPEG